MLVVDVNVLVYAHRTDAPRHREYLAWLDAARSGDEPIGLMDTVLSGFVRIVTHPKVFREPSGTGEALAFVRAVRSAPAALHVHPSARTWPIFEELVEWTDAAGNLIPDALLAAMTIEQGAALVTADRGFARWPRLEWLHPLDVKGTAPRTG